MNTLPFEFKGVVRLTRTGTIYLVSTMVLAISAVNTGNNALYIAVSLMLGCLLLSGLASKGGLKKLELELLSIDEAWAARETAGTIRLRNRSRIWSVRDVVLTSEAFAQPILIPVLPHRSELTVAATFLFPRRGMAQVSAIDSYTRYPFGFFLKKRRMRVASDVIVYPRVLADDTASERFRSASGDQTPSNRPGPGTEIHAFRDYVRGDSLRQVHWKKSASVGRWIMKQTEAEDGRSVHVVVDPYKSRETTDEELEEMISAAATFVFHSLARGLDVTLLLPRMTLRTREAEGAAPLFRALALLEPIYEPVNLLIDRDAVVFSTSHREPERSPFDGLRAGLA
jgi:uncharacterized protein (DUF58 family)